MSTTPDLYRGFRFPADIISHTVWLYHCFSLSLRAVELILAQRGIVVSYESIRAWTLRFGRAFASSLKRRRPRPGDKWHLDEVFVRIRGKLHCLWRPAPHLGVRPRSGSAAGPLQAGHRPSPRAPPAEFAGDSRAAGMIRLSTTARTQRLVT
jgi:hypothetical protein